MDFNLESITFDQFDDDLQFLKTWKDSWKIFDVFFAEKNMSYLREKNYDITSEIIKTLIEIGNVKLDLILNIAQLYVFCELTNENPSVFQNNFGKIVVEATDVLLKNKNSPEKIFTEEKYSYIEKVKLAEYIFELNHNPSTKKLTEIKNMILFNENSFKNNSLFDELKSKIKNCR